jgi:hypothetical protein
MKSTFLTIISVVAVVFLVQLTSCREKENQNPVIVVDEPTDGAMTILPDSTHIEGTVTDEDALHELSLVIKNHMGDTVFAQYPTVHALKTYNFHYHFATSDTGMYHLHVTAEDHDGGEAEKEVIFHVMQ